MSFEGMNDSPEALHALGIASRHSQEVVHIASAKNLTRYEFGRGAAVLDQRRIPWSSTLLQHMADNRLHDPHGPTPTHRDAAKAVVDPFIGLHVNETPVFPDLGDSSFSGTDRMIKGKVLGQGFRVELVEAVQ